LIIGDDELERGEAQLKNLATGEQRSVSLDLISEALRS
jgi:histidyl-tRNA synthetase